MAATLAKAEQKIRFLLRDFNPDYNILLDDLHFESSEIECALELAADAYNVLPVRTGYTWQQMPAYLAVIGACYHLNWSEAHLQARNQISLPTDHQEVIGVDDKAGLYLTLRRELKSEFDKLAREDKDSVNAQSFFGSLSSDYVYLGRNW